MFRLLRLEDRIVLDGAALTDLLDEMHSQEMHEQQMADADAQADDASAADDIGIDTDAMLYIDDVAADDTGTHVLVISSEVKDGEDLAAAAKDNVIVVKYDPAKTTLDDLSAMIKDALGGEKADSIAFASHYTNTGIMALSGSDAMSADSLESSADQQEFWKSVGGMVDDGGRIDLLACDVAGKDGGEEFVSKIESISGVNVAASVDPTGNEAYGGDWVLETDNVDVQATYFESAKLEKFDELLGAQPPVVNADVVDRVYSWNTALNKWDAVYFKVTPGYTDSNDPTPVLPSGQYAFTDPDVGDTLTYSATNDSGGWLSFNTSTWVFSGNPLAVPSTGGSVTVWLSATDTDSNKVTQEFEILFQRIDTTLPYVSLAVTPTTLYEDGSPNAATVTANLTKSSTSNVTVYLGFDGSAVSTDYTVGSGTLVIPAGSTSASTTLTIASDTVPEGTETVMVLISTAPGANISTASYSKTISIIDNDGAAAPTVNLSMSPTSVTEGNAATITATLSSAAPAGGVTVSLGYTGTFESGDFTAANSIFITGGSSTGNITFQTNQDDLDLDNEAVTVSITGVVGASLGATTSVNATIIDNDYPSIALTVSPTTFSEENGTTKVTATLSQAAGAGGATVYLAFTGTALSTDYTKSAGFISVAAGATSGFVTLTGTPDTVTEGDKTIIIDVASATGATEATQQQVTATVLDDDLVTVSLSASQLSFAEEGGTTVITATLNKTSGSNVYVTLGYSGTAGADDLLSMPANITVFAGSTTGSVMLTGKSDTLIEGPESLTVSISTVGGASAGTPSSITTTILDDDMSLVTLGVSAVTFAENAGSYTVTAYVSPSAGPGGVTVDLGFAGSALFGTDYTVGNDPIYIAQGLSSASATVTVVNDSLVEGDETVTASISSITGPATAGAVKTVSTTIVDDDAVYVSLGIDNVSILENAGTAKVTAYLSKAAGETVTVNLGYGGVATGADYGTTGTFITISLGATSGSVTITATSDQLVEGNETIIVTGTPVNASLGTPLSVTANIIDDDLTPVNLSLSGSPFKENAGIATVTAVLDQPSANNVIVGLDFAGTGGFGTDYTASATFITILAGQTNGQISLKGVDDALVEFEENVIVTIANVSGGATFGATKSVTALITDDEVPIATLAINKGDIAETGGTAVVTVTLDKPAGSAGVFVPLVVSGDVTGSDYFISPTTVNIASGASIGTATIYASSDTWYEGNEKMIISMGALSGAVKGSPDVVNATIIDDDAMPNVTLSASATTFAEGGASVVLTATLSKPSAVPTTVDLSFAGTALQTTDYTASATQIVIAAGKTTGTVFVSPLTDSLVEGTETVIADISAVVNASEATAQQVTLSLTDATALPTVTLGISSTQFSENLGSAVITATMSNTSFAPVTVDLNFAGTGTFSTDYTVDKTYIVIPAGSTSATMTLTGKDDTITEQTESVTVSISNVAGANTAAPASVSASIIDDEGTPTVNLSLSKATFAENAGSTVVTATLSQATFQNVTVNLGYSGTAEAADYTAAASSGTTTSLVIPAGSTTASVTLTGVDDPNNEPDETVIVSMTGVFNANTGATALVTASLIDDDAQPSVTLSLINGSSFTETGPGSATVMATLSAKTMETVTIELGLAGTALYGTDYTATPTATVITINPGNVTGSVKLTAVDDSSYEGTETVTVDLVSVTGASEMTAQSVSLTLADNDAAPLVSLVKMSADPIEGGPAMIDVVLSTVSGLPVTVELGFTGTALAGTDYAASPATVVIPAGLTSTNAVFTTVADFLYEGDENFTVSLGTLTNAAASASASSVAFTIIDDDDKPTVTLGPALITIGENTQTATITAYLSAPNGVDTTISLDLSSGTAKLTSDYTVSSTIVIAAGKTTGTVTLTSVEDTIFEGNEIAVVKLGTLSEGVTAGATNNSASVAIVDNDSVSVSLGISPTTLAETTADTATVTAYLSNTSGNDITVNLSFTGKAAQGVDYTIATGIFITAGNTTGSVVLTPVDDTVYEGNENLGVDVTNLTVAGLTMSATVTGTRPVTATITDDADLPKATVSFVPTTFAEGTVGSTTLATVTLDKASYQPVTVTLSYSGTALSVTDYTGGSTTLVISAGQTTGAVTLTAVDDVIFEGTESVIVNLTAVSGATLGATLSATSSLVDNDGQPNVTLGLSTQNIAEGGATSVVTAYMNRPSATDVTVNLNVTLGTAVASDYTVTPQTYIVVQAGKMTGSVTLGAFDDCIYEGPETLTLGIASAVGATYTAGTGQAVIITDNESAPAVNLSVSPGMFPEDTGSAVVTATLTNASALPVTVNLSYGGTAVATDYSAVASSGTTASLVIPAGSTTGTITLTGTSDTLYEGYESVIVGVSGTPDNATLGTVTSVTATIDDSADWPKVTLSVNPTSFGENGGTALVVATLDKANTVQDVTVNLSYAGTAVASDYGVTPATAIVIAKGQTTGSITLTGTNDPNTEGTETVVIDISSVIGASENGVQQVTASLIDDDDMPTVTLSGGASFGEDGGTALVTATLSGTSYKNITVYLSMTGAAGLGTDYTAVPAFISIPAGSLTSSLTVQGKPDALYEGDEAFTVTVSNTSVNVSTATLSSSAYTVLDGDGMPTVTLGLSPASSFTEDSGTTLVVATLTQPSVGTVTIDLSFAGTALSTTDYTTPDGTQIVIGDGKTTGSIQLKAAGDSLYEGTETVIVTMGTVTGSAVGTGTVTAQLVDNDTQPSVALSASTITINEEVSGTSVITLTLSNPSVQDVTVTLGVSTGSTAEPEDYTLSATQVMIPAGSTTASVTLKAENDSVYEPTAETVIVDVLSVVNGSEVTAQSTTISITSTDPAPQVSLSVSKLTFSETLGTTLVIATMDRASDGLVTVDLDFTGGSALFGTDYTTAAGATKIVIAAGQTTGSLLISAKSDVLYELEEGIRIEMGTVEGASESGTQVVVASIIDDDAGNLPKVTLSMNPDSFAEDSGTTLVVATLDKAAGTDVTVNLSYAGTAVAGDYAVGTFIFISAGNTTGSITLSGTPDTVYEGDETVTANISSLVNATNGLITSATATINDGLDLPDIDLRVVGTSSTFSENFGSLTLEAYVNGAGPGPNVSLGVPVTVTLDISGTAIYGVDYTTSPVGCTIVIPVGSTSAFLTLTGKDDYDVEGTETVIATISTVTPIKNGTIGAGTNTWTVSIVDDDKIPEVTLSVSNVTMPETNGSTVVTATLGTPAATTVTVHLGLTGTVNGQAEYNADYNAFGGGTAIFIGAGKTTGSLTLQSNYDVLYEGDEGFNITVTSVAGPATDNITQTLTVTIIDDDQPPSVTLSLSKPTFLEDGGTSEVIATLSGGAALTTVTIDLNFAGTALDSGATDYTHSATQIVIGLGKTTGSITLEGKSDSPASIYEGSESVIVSIATMTPGATLGTVTSVTATIDDSADIPTVTLGPALSSFGENDGTFATVTATLSNASNFPVTVDLSIGGTGSSPASAGDYGISGTQIVITSGTTGFVQLYGINDEDVEGTETVVIDIAAVAGASEATAQSVTLSIVDDDTAIKPSVTLGLSNATFSELYGTTVVTAYLDRTTFSEVTVALDFTGSEAGASDYTLSSAYITIPTGSLTGTLTITGAMDTLYEGDETLIIGVGSHSANATEVGTQQVTAVITDNPATTPPKVNLSVKYLGGSDTSFMEDTGTAAVIATLDKASGSTVTVELAFAGSAEVTDYNAVPTFIVIPAGSTTGFITLNGVLGSVYEGDESIEVSVTAITGATAGTVLDGTATISDLEDLPKVTLYQSTGTMPEVGGVNTITVYLSNASELPVTVDLDFSGKAEFGTDYKVSSGKSVVFMPGEVQNSITVLSTSDDKVGEGSESVIVSIGTVTGGTAGASNLSVTSTILDDEGIPTVSLALTGGCMAEAGGTATVVATLAYTYAEDLTVTLAVANGAGVYGTDYSMSGTTTDIIIPAGQTTGSAVVFTAIQDNLYEGNETIGISIVSMSPGVYTAAPFAVTATIIEDDLMPVVNLSPISHWTEGDGGGAGGTVMVIATLDKASALPVTVDLTFSGSTAVNPSDYTVIGGATKIFIPAGSTNGSVTLEAFGDEIYEGSLDTVIVGVSGTPANATLGTVKTVTATIDDSDDLPTVTLSFGKGTGTTNGEFTESFQTALVIATLSNASEIPVTVTLGFSGNAVQGIGSDYITVPMGQTSIVIPGNGTSTTGTLVLQGLEDDLSEKTEGVQIDILSVTNGSESGGAQTLTASLVDTTTPPKVTLALSSNTFMEDLGTTTLIVSLDKATYQDVTVDLNFTAMDAGKDSDYQIAATQVFIPAGQTTQSVILTGIPDNTYENDGTGVIGQERVIIGVTGTAIGVTYTGLVPVTAVIDDSADLPTVTLSVSSGTLAEGTAQAATVTAVASKASESPLTVALAYSGTASKSTDYDTNDLIVINANFTTGTMSGPDVISAIDDNSNYEYQESVIIDIDVLYSTGLTGTVATEGTANQVTVTITDEEDKPQVKVAYSLETFVENGGTTQLLATLVHPSDGNKLITSVLPTTVTIAYTGTATFGSDYSAVTTIVIPANISTGSITLSGVADSDYEGNETVKATVSAVENGTPWQDSMSANSNATAVIEEASALPKVTLSLSSPTFGENGGKTNVIATLNAPSFQTVTVNLGFAGTAGASDYTAGATQIVIGAGKTTGSVTLTGTNDFIYEGTETVIVDIVAVANGEEDGTQQVTASLVDDETPPQVFMWLSSNTMNENGGSTTVITQMLYPSVNPVTVTLSYTDNGAAPLATDNGMAESNDYAGLTTIVIPAGQTTASMELTTVDDSIYEDDETFVIAITAVDGGSIKDGVQDETVTIVDDEVMEIFWSSDISVNEGIGGTTTWANLVVDRTPVESEYEVKVDWATGTGTATAGSDYEANSGTVNLGKTYTTGSVQIIVNGDDDEGEPDETFEVQLSNASVGSITDTSATVTIINYVNQAPRSDGAWIVKAEGTTLTAGTVIGSFTVTDDRPVTAVMSVAMSPNDTLFTVDSAPAVGGTVNVTMNADLPLDYENQDFYVLDVYLEDAQGAYTYIQVVIEVQDVADSGFIADTIADKTLTPTGFVTVDVKTAFKTELTPVSYTITNLPSWMTFTNGNLVARGVNAVAAGVTPGTTFTLNVEAVFMHWDGTTGTATTTLTVDYIASLDIDPLMEAIKYLDGGEDYLLPEEGEAVDVNEVMIARSEAPVYDDAAMYEETPAEPAVDPELAEIVALLDQEIIMIDPETARV